MENLDIELEELLMRYEAGVLTLDEEATLARKLGADPLARRALVFAFLLSGEASRRLAVRSAPAREKAQRFSPAWLAAGVGLAAAAALLMAFSLGWPGGAGKDRPAMLPAGEDGKDAPKPKEDPKPAPQNDEVKIVELIKQLGDDEQAKRDEAANELRKLGEKAVVLLEKAAADKDPERSSRAKAILRAFQVDKVLAEVDAAFFKAADLQAEVKYGLLPRQTLKGTYKHAEGGRKFFWETEQVLEANQKYSNLRTFIGDGETIWSCGKFVMQGQPERKTFMKVACALQEKQDLAWNGVHSFPLPPMQVLKLARNSTRFSTTKDGTLDGQGVWVLEGPVPEDKRSGMTFGGSRAGANTQNGLSNPGSGAALAKQARLYVSKADNTVLKAEALAEDGAVLWDLSLSKVKAGVKTEASNFQFTPPEGAKVADLSKNLGGTGAGGGDPNNPQVQGGNK